MSIKLAKSGDSAKISLRKEPDAPKTTIHVNLQWKSAAAANPPKKSGGFWGGLFGGGDSTPAAAQKEDLDLGCMWEDTKGGKGVIQALGNSFGSKTAHPFIQLDKDDRDGNSADGENLFIFDPTVLKRVLVFAYIYEGSAFASVDASVTLKVSNGETIEIDLDAPSRDRSFCAAALIEVKDGVVTVRKDNQYHAGHEQCDRAYGFGFTWKRGSKD